MLIVDKAHRLQGREGARECVKYARLTVFLADDHQVIVPSEIESHRWIIESARSDLLPPSEVREPHLLDLTSEPRCASEVYVRWIDSVLGIRPVRRPRVSSSYHFEIVDSPQELESKLERSGGTWRMVAGMCWRRSEPMESGPLADYVALPEFDFRRPWNPDRETLEVANPQRQTALRWAQTNLDAKRYIGNVYMAQGFEFDYVGVIFGKDLVRRDGRWKPELQEHQREKDELFHWKGLAKRRAPKCLANVHRVPLTRGRKGCNVFFHDRETRDYAQCVMSESELGL